MTFHSKIIKLEMNALHLIAASKDIIFVFALKDMALVARLSVPHHLLRVTLASQPLLDSQGRYCSLIAYSGMFNKGKVNFH